MTFFKSWRTRIALVLAVVGPGFITANVDNDAGGIATYSVAGAQFGYSLLWTMIPITIALVIVQEMSSRMGAVTGKGLSEVSKRYFFPPLHSTWPTSPLGFSRIPTGRRQRCRR